MATDRSSWDFEEGDEIAPGRTVLKPIGGGSAYEVLLVWDDRLFSIMVAKVVRPDKLEDAGTMRGLGREADALRTLAHPCLIRGFDAVLDPPYPHVLIEHLEGPTLRRLIKRHGPLPQEQLLPLALHVASVLHYLAEEELVHLDVKPDNIVMGVPPRLIDLSVARTFERARRLEAAIGTDPYMAPEQCGTLEYRGAIGGTTDVWGLGATLFHAVTGHLPFPRQGDERFPQLADDPQPLPAEVPEALRELLLAMLRKDPAKRPTAKEAALALEPLVASMPKLVRLGRGGAKHRPGAPI
jgi:serine/threonine protein kinase